MKKKPIAQHMPKTWSLALLFLHENRNSGNPRTREQIRAASGCGSDVLTALHRMGAIRQFEHKGKMYPTLDENVTVPTPVAIREKIREMNERRDKEVINALQEAINNRERHEADPLTLSPPPVGSTAENWKRSLQERGTWQSEPAASLSEAIEESGCNTYTKEEVILRFKAFYTREYKRLDDRAYTLCGFLLTALED